MLMQYGVQLHITVATVTSYVREMERESVSLCQQNALVQNTEESKLRHGLSQINHNGD